MRRCVAAVLGLTTLSSCSAHVAPKLPAAPTSLTSDFSSDLSASELTELINAEANYAAAAQASFSTRYLELLRDLTSSYSPTLSQDGSAFQFGAYRFFSRTLPAQSESVLIRSQGAQERTVLDINQTSPGDHIVTLAISSDGEKLAYTTSDLRAVVKVMNLEDGSKLEIKRSLPISDIQLGGDSIFLLESQNSTRGVQVSECALSSGQCQIRQQTSQDDEQILLRRLDDQQIIESRLISPRGELNLTLQQAPPSAKLCESRIDQPNRGTKIDFGAISASHSAPIVREVQNFCTSALVLASCDATDCLYLAKAGTPAIAIELPKQLQSVSLGPNPERHSDTANIVIESLIDPPATYSIDLNSARLINAEKLKADRLCKFSQISIGTRDNQKVPVSLCLPLNFKAPGPLVVLVYGAYGTPLRAHYSRSWRLLLDRGVGLAFAHVRGGGEFGEAWHLAGSGKNKHHSAEDLIDVTRALIERGFTTRSKVGAWARSAGALTLALTIAFEPELFKVAVLVAPFVQPYAVNDPLNASERGEWGDVDPLKELINRGKSTYPATLLLVGARDEIVDPIGALRWIHTLRAKAQNSAARIFSLSATRDHNGEANAATQMQAAALEAAFFLGSFEK